MEQKMAPGTGLAPRQKQFLAVVLQEPYILKRFYLSGGTALSCWYLHHRESYDLDFFTDKEVNLPQISRWLLAKKADLGFTSSHYEEQLGFYFFYMEYPNGDKLKVDFSYFPSEKIERGLIWKGLSIDSLYDIAVNKLETIIMQPRARDYIDLYYILREQNWKLDKLKMDSANKFGIHTDELELAKKFLMVSEFVDFPKMLVPFDRKEMEKFFLAQVKSLKSQIFI